MHPMFNPTLNPEAREGLRDMLLILDFEEELAYVADNSLTVILAFANPADYFPRKFLDLAREVQTQTRFMRMDALYATDLDAATKRYMPLDGRQYEPLASTPTWMHLSVSPSSCRSDLKTWENSYAGETVSLSRLFRAGRATPVYGSAQRFGKRKAQQYLFRTNKRDLCLNGPMTRTLDALKLDIRLPREHPNPGVSGLPRLGITNESGDIIGLIRPDRTGGELQTRDGRTLFHESTVACWFLEEECLQQLHSPSLHDPSGIIPMDMLVSELADEDRWFAGRDGIRHAVSGLRWKGYTDDEIQDAYEAARPRVLQWLYDDMIASVEDEVERLAASDGFSDARLNAVQDSAKRYERLYLALCEYRGVELDPGLLPELLDGLELTT